MPFDESLDASGYSPEALRQLLELGVQLPAEPAAELARGMGLAVSRAELDRLLRDYGVSCRAASRQWLEAEAFTPLEPARPVLAQGQGRLMVLQADGCFVLGQAETGGCPGVEVKAAAVYPVNAPRERVLFADVIEARQMLGCCSGLLRAAGVRQDDTIIGLSDGAVWIGGMFETLGIPHVLDVYHSSQYQERVMTAAGWTEAERELERRSWLRGEIDGGQWLSLFVPGPEKRTGWDEEARAAVSYLQARVGLMAYPSYKAKGWPIGSGQIEGVNKSVIGHRMKRSGQHWSRQGAGGMAAQRALRYSRRAPLTFEGLRHTAFPVPQC